MPTYTYECGHCGEAAEAILPVSERHTAAPECHGKMQLVIQAAMVSPDIAPYRAVAGDRMGQMITSRREHREFLKRNRFTEVGNEPVKPIRNDTRPKKGEIAKELKEVIQPYLR